MIGGGKKLQSDLLETSQRRDWVEMVDVFD